jgi:hypothetical protein
MTVRSQCEAAQSPTTFSAELGVYFAKLKILKRPPISQARDFSKNRWVALVSSTMEEWGFLA